MHIYTCQDGIEVPSVTTILQCLGSKSLLKWANYLGFKHIDYEEELERSASNGTKIHECLQHAVDPKLFEDKIVFANSIEADYYTRITNRFLKVMSKYKYKTIYTETTFTSSKLGYGGTLDWLCEINDKKILGDFKSSKKVHMKHILQLGGYKNLLAENGIEIDGAMIIIVNDAMCFPYFVGKNKLDELGEVFNMIAKIYKYLEIGLSPTDENLERLLREG